MHCILLWLWFLVMWQEYHVFGSTSAGESPEEGKEENTEKVILYYKHISVEYMVLHYTVPSQYLDVKAPIVVITP